MREIEKNLLVPVGDVTLCCNVPSECVFSKKVIRELNVKLYEYIYLYVSEYNVWPHVT